jgi:hypothetical protein
MTNHHYNGTKLPTETQLDLKILNDYDMCSS